MNANLKAHPEFEGGLTRRLAVGRVADANVISIRAVVRRQELDWCLIQTIGAADGAGCCSSTRHRCANVTVLQDGEVHPTAIDSRLGGARHVLDQFHAARWCIVSLSAANPPE